MIPKEKINDMPDSLNKMDRNFALEAIRVTEAAALAASRLIGRGDKDGADQAAVDAMFSASAFFKSDLIRTA